MAERRQRGDRSPQDREFLPSRGYLLAVLMSWLVPGMGHWIMGFRVRGILLAVILLGTFWWGEVVAGGYAVIREEHDIFFYGQVGNGLSALVANRLQWAKDCAKAIAGGDGVRPMPLSRNPLCSGGVGRYPSASPACGIWSH